MKARMKGGARNTITSLQVAVQVWPTPMAGTPAQNGNNAAGSNDFTRRAEELAAAMWGMPRASDAEKGGPNQSFGAGGTPLPAQAAMWTTPQAHDVRQRGSGQTLGQRNNKAGNACLATDAATWPTPAARDTRSEEASPEYQSSRWEHSRGKPLTEVARIFTPPALPTWPHGTTPSLRTAGSTSYRLLRWMMRSYGPTITRRLWAARHKRRLNPLFVEWLMGWPPGHALCDCSATEWSRWSQDMRGALSRLPTASGAWILEERTHEPVKQLALF